MSSPLFNCSNELWSGNEIGKSADMVSFQLFNFWWNNRKIYFHQCFLQLLVITVTSCPLSKLPRLINRWHWFAALPPTNLLGLIVQKETNNRNRCIISTYCSQTFSKFLVYRVLKLKFWSLVSLRLKYIHIKFVDNLKIINSN